MTVTLPPVLFFESYRFFEGIGIERVDDVLDALPDEGIGLGVDFHFGGAGHLLQADDDVHAVLAFLLRRFMAMAFRRIWLVPS